MHCAASLLARLIARYPEQGYLRASAVESSLAYSFVPIRQGNPKGVGACPNAHLR
jgi:hypothetical protein